MPTSTYLSSPHIRAVIFDLDGTLAPSKSRIATTTADLLVRLLQRVDVCIISGGTFEQFDTQVLRYLTGSATLERLHLMPTCGTQYWQSISSSWHRVYSEELAADVRAHIIDVLTEGARTLGLTAGRAWGATVDDRGTQVTYSALGQQAPLAAKTAWDPEGSKKARLRSYAATRLPELEVRSGGSTSIDVTSKGVDKAYGVAKLQRYLHLDLGDLLFLGDRLDVDGNDYPVMRMGVTCIPVTGWEDTDERITDLLEAPARACRGEKEPPGVTISPAEIPVYPQLTLGTGGPLLIRL